MGQQALNNELRNSILNQIVDFFKQDNDVLPISASEITIPVVDSEGNEKFAIIKVSIPLGTRNGQGGYEPYDGYAQAEEWKLVMADKADKKAASAEKKARAEQERARKRAAKKVIHQLNTEGFQALVHKTDPEPASDTKQPDATTT